MFSWAIAATAPSTIDATDRKMMTCRHSLTNGPNGSIINRTKSASAAILGATAKNIVTGVGAPSYTSGVHIWNGTAETLKARPTTTKTRPITTPVEDAAPPATSWAISLNAVVPVNP